MIFSLQIQFPTEKTEPAPYGAWFGFCNLVDVNGLEPLTLRTSSECSTS